MLAQTMVNVFLQATLCTVHMTCLQPVLLPKYYVLPTRVTHSGYSMRKKVGWDLSFSWIGGFEFILLIIKFLITNTMVEIV